MNDLVARALPPDWSTRLEREPGRGTGRPDGILRIEAPDLRVAEFAVDARRSMTTQSMLQAVDHLRTYIDTGGRTPLLPLIVTTYLSPRAKELLAERGISYADVTGNLRLVAPRPGLFIERLGATKDPAPDDHPLRSLKGRGAGRAVRALVDVRPPYGVRELSARAAVPAATLSRVINLLNRDALLTKDDTGSVTDIDWGGTIRRWAQDYEMRRSNALMSFLEPRGISAVAEKLTKATWRYAVTGSLAAQRFAPIAPARTAVVYVEDAARAADRLRLRPAEVGANVVLAEPFDEVVWDRTLTLDRLVTVAPSQLAADLLTGPGREPSEGEELLVWMRKNQSAWRI